MTSLLKKFITFIVLDHVFWVLAYIPMLPTTAIQLALAFWILIPNNQGEKAVYGMLSTWFDKFVDYFAGAIS